MKILGHSSFNKNFTRASDIVIPDIYNRRFKTGKEGLDFLFGGSGFLPGFTFTLAAAPGTGKTSLLLQMLELLEKTGKKTAYISGEETVEQLAFTSRRLGVTRVPLANLTSLEEMEKTLRSEKFDFVVLDSFPTIKTEEPGSKTAKESHIISRLIQTAKETETVLGTILHFTKGGSYKGSTELPHAVDANIIMTKSEDDWTLRELEVTKNRFGSAAQVAFRMTDNGFTFEAEEMEKESRPASKKDLILEALKEPSTAPDLLNNLDVSKVYLNNLLKEMVDRGTVSKKGKGSEAIYSLKEKE